MSEVSGATWRVSKHILSQPVPKHAGKLALQRQALPAYCLETGFRFRDSLVYHHNREDDQRGMHDVPPNMPASKTPIENPCATSAVFTEMKGDDVFLVVVLCSLLL